MKSVLTMEVVFETVVGDELVHQHPLRTSNAVPDEGHQVAVVDVADDVDLSLEFPLPLPTPRLELFHRDLLPVWENPLVHVPKSSLS